MFLYTFTYLQELRLKVESLPMKDALLKKTKTKILDLIKHKGTLSVDEATKTLRLAKSTVRQHLLAMEKQGLVVEKRNNIGTGRPQLAYQVSESANKLFPSQDAELLKKMLTRLIEDGHKEWVDGFFKDYWKEKKIKFQNILKEKKKNDPKTIRQVLYQVLKDEGFMPEIVEAKDSLIVKECHCPFSEAVKATQIPCRLEAEFLKDVMKTDLKRESYIPTGSSSCAYRTLKK